ncbi:MAG: NADAR family protein [Ruminococcus sp.]|uniref:NADAR family protein n=1 Tax=Ruminococcus sp. TaxID=41978 RepID=UPI0025E98790|nr:NADAR family protein [Ruminococcus sp.]MBR0528617.1 NADAR family protein [Ruminococcus sp.]
MIDSFKGDYCFLSNFYEAKVTYEGITYLNNEAAFQSIKTTDMAKRRDFADLDPAEAKKAGRNVCLRGDWEDIKINMVIPLTHHR